MSMDNGNMPAGLRQVGNGVFVAGQIEPGNVEALAREGCTVLICNRPDNEAPGQPSADSIRAEAQKHGIAFHYIPVGHGGVSADMVEQMRTALADTDGLVVCYCRSGARSAQLYAFARP